MKRFNFNDSIKILIFFFVFACFSCSPSEKQGFDVVNVYQGGGIFGFGPRMSSPIDVEEGTVLSEALTDLGINFIEDAREKPFFLFIAHFDVHVQLDTDSALIQKYLNKEAPEEIPGNAVYAAMVEHVDQSTGRILNKLDELGLSENTLVVFFSDNWGLISRFDELPLVENSKQYLYEENPLLYIASSNAPLRAEKGTPYEVGKPRIKELVCSSNAIQDPC